MIRIPSLRTIVASVAVGDAAGLVSMGHLALVRLHGIGTGVLGDERRSLHENTGTSICTAPLPRGTDDYKSSVNNRTLLEKSDCCILPHIEMFQSSCRIRGGERRLSRTPTSTKPAKVGDAELRSRSLDDLNAFCSEVSR